MGDISFNSDKGCVQLQVRCGVPAVERSHIRGERIRSGAAVSEEEISLRQWTWGCGGGKNQSGAA